MCLESAWENTQKETKGEEGGKEKEGGVKKNNHKEIG